MPTGAQRFAKQQLQQHATAATAIPNLPLAQVTAVTAGGGTDGNSLVTVSYNGASLALPHLAQYTPVVNDVVVLIRAGGQWIAAGKAVGFP